MIDESNPHSIVGTVGDPFINCLDYIARGDDLLVVAFSKTFGAEVARYPVRRASRSCFVIVAEVDGGSVDEVLVDIPKRCSGRGVRSSRMSARLISLP